MIFDYINFLLYFVNEEWTFMFECVYFFYNLL